jgi:hypothetical protein
MTIYVTNKPSFCVCVCGGGASLTFNELITVVISEVCNVFCWSDTRIVGLNYNLDHRHLYAFVCLCVVLCRLCVCMHVPLTDFFKIRLSLPEG